MKNYCFHIGIDVSKLKLDVNLLNAQSLESEHFIVRNSYKDLKIFIKTLTKRKIDISQVLFCCENTGVYSNHLINACADLNLDLWVVAAIEIKRSKGVCRVKSDRTDAKDISYYSLRNIDKLTLYSLDDLDLQKLKLLHTEREKAVKSLMIMQASKENADFVSKEAFREVSKINKNLLAAIKKSIKAIEDKMKKIIQSNQQLRQQAALIKSVPGIGDQTSLYLIIATKGFNAFPNWRKFACYSGVAPFEYSSGSSIRGRTKVNHMADKKMKSLLQMCAMTSMKYDAQLKQYYQKKKAEGKNSMLILNNVRCKLLSRVFAVVRRGTPYIDTYKFAS